MIPLDFLRSLNAQFRPDTCAISRPTDTASGDGTARSWSNVATGVTCRVSVVSNSAQESLGAGAGMRALAQFTVWLPAGQDVTARDRIVVGSRTFEVARVGARSYEVERECICWEVT